MSGGEYTTRFTASQKCRAAEREFRWRRKTYPTRIGKPGGFTAEECAHQIAIMEEIANDYRQVARAQWKAKNGGGDE